MCQPESHTPGVWVVGGAGTGNCYLTSGARPMFEYNSDQTSTRLLEDVPRTACSNEERVMNTWIMSKCCPRRAWISPASGGPTQSCLQPAFWGLLVTDHAGSAAGPCAHEHTLPVREAQVCISVESLQLHLYWFGNLLFPCPPMQPREVRMDA